MKKLFTKTFALIVMGIFATTMAFAQGQGGHSHTTTDEDPIKGAGWEIFHFPKIDRETGNPVTGGDGKVIFYDRHYYNGGIFDNLKIGKVLGHHWMGHKVEELSSGEEIFLCNVATGEYLQIGDYWGEATMTNHAGIEYRLEPTKLMRKVTNWQAFADDNADAYWICPILTESNKQDRCVGRCENSDGIQGHFERNRYLALRHKDEYRGDGYIINASGERVSGSPGRPGGIAFQFHPVTTSDGKQAYIIYTHRQTDESEQVQASQEFWNRDSYILLKSAGHLRAGYNAVRWKKFAGQMYGKPGTSTSVTISDQTDLSSITTDELAKSTNAHKYGTYNSANGGTTFTTNATSGLEGVTVSISNGTLGAGYRGNNGHYTFNHTMEFYPPVIGAGSATLTIKAPTGYVITAYKVTGLSWDGSRQFRVVTPKKTYDNVYAAAGRCNINESGYNDTSISLTISTVYGTSSTIPLCFPQFSVVLEKTSNDNDWPNTIAKYSGSESYKNAPLYDELDYCDADGNGKQYLSFAEATNPSSQYYVGNDNNNLWKIVTKEERARYRLVASEEKPVDMTYKIKNPKFYTSYTYARTLKADANATAEDVKTSDWVSGTPHGHYVHANGERDFGWQWFDVDRATHYTNHHVHPWNQHKITDTSINPGYYDPENQTTPREREYHKVGTGLFYRYNAPNVVDNIDEFDITYGQESNYVGSIWKGTTNLQQTITGLREGLYVVRVKGFFAPHDMMKYAMSGTDAQRDNASTSSALAASDQWYKEAVVTTDGPDKGKWKRSHDSYLFAWSYPNGLQRKATEEDVAAGLASSVGEDIDNDPEEVRRMLPSIYEGAVKMSEISEEEKINAISKESFLISDDLAYTYLGAYGSNNQKELLKDNAVYAKYNGAYFSENSTPREYDGLTSGEWMVPKTLFGAGRLFNLVDGIQETETTSYKNPKNYQISLPVYVGSDGNLVIGVDHTLVHQTSEYTRHFTNPDTGLEETETITIPKSGDDEWVCFDDFELLYLGKQEPDEFVMDELHGRMNIGKSDDPDFYEYDSDTGNAILDGSGKNVPLNGPDGVLNKNNTQWVDLFDPSDITTGGLDVTTVKKLVIRRTMTKDGWNSIVFPVSLTGNQIKEGFGENAKVAYLTGITDLRGSNNTIEYTLVDLETGGGETKVIEAGQPYVIKPSREPIVGVNDDPFERSRYSIAYSAKAEGVANMYLKTKERNKEIERKIAGPIYIIEDVEIKVSEVFPDVTTSTTETSPEGAIWHGINDSSDGGNPSAANRIAGFGTKKIGLFQVMGKPESEKYNLMETAHYYGGGTIPAYSYFHTNGQIYYTQKNLTTNKGLYAYLQLIHQTTNEAYTKPFIGGTDIFIPVIEEDIDGIEDVNIVPDLDGNSSMVIYDLMGRKVTNPRPGNIYIMNGVKVMFK